MVSDPYARRVGDPSYLGPCIMSNHSLSSIMGLTSCPTTGKVLALRVCAHCEREGNQGSFIRSYARVLKCEGVSHGICPTHYQTQLARMMGERETEVEPSGPTGGPNHPWERRCVVISA